MTVPDPAERLTLAEQLAELALALGEDRAKMRLGQAFRRKEIPYTPNFAVSYEDADIDWLTGKVTLQRPFRRTFIPTLTRAEFGAHFVPARTDGADKQKIRARSQEIHAAIAAVYDDAKKRGVPPPNMKKLPKLVKAKLNEDGRDATYSRITKLANAPDHKARRRERGRTIAVERLWKDKEISE